MISKQIVLTLLFIVSYIIGFSQELKDTRIAIEFVENGKYGLKTEQGEVIVPPKYDSIGYFFETDYHSYSIAQIMSRSYNSDSTVLTEKFGLINNYGEELIAPKYDFIDFFFRWICASI